MVSNEANELSDQQQENVAGQVMESLGDPQEAPSVEAEAGTTEDHGSKDPVYVQKRLKQQRRAYEREMGGLREEIHSLHKKFETMSGSAMSNTYEPTVPPTDMSDHIQHAVNVALNAKREEERAAREHEARSHVDNQRRVLNQHLDKMNDKYDDFEDVVRGQDTPYTQHMADAALMLPRSGPGSAGEVLYKLGNNRPELERIGKLHPLDQASEMVKLSHALMGEKEAPQQRSTSSNPMGSVKNSPVSSSREINENTSISALRKMAKAGWKDK